MPSLPIKSNFLISALIALVVGFNCLPGYAEEKAPWVGETLEGEQCVGGRIGFGPHDYMRRAQLPAELEVVEEDSLGLDTESWSRPITFLPNGRTSNARITVWGEDGRHMVVLLRGFTGTATIGDMRRAEKRETELELDEVQE
jgi:hypothetical protein